MNLVDRMPATVMLYKATLGLVIGTALILVMHPVDGVDLATRCAGQIVVLGTATAGTTLVEVGAWLLGKVNKK